MILKTHKKLILSIIFNFFFDLILLNIVIAQPESIEFVCNKLKDKDPKEREVYLCKFVQQINRLKAFDAIDCFIPTLKDNNLKVKQASNMLIGELFLKPSNETVTIRNYDHVDRLELNQFYLQAAEKVIPYLIISLKDENYKVRKYALISLGYIGPPAQKAIPYIKALLEDKNKSVREDAEIALRLLN